MVVRFFADGSTEVVAAAGGGIPSLAAVSTALGSPATCQGVDAVVGTLGVAGGNEVAFAVGAPSSIEIPLAVADGWCTF